MSLRRTLLASALLAAIGVAQAAVPTATDVPTGPLPRNVVPSLVQLQLKVDRERLSKEIAELEKVIANSQRQLSNEAFIAKAPEKIVAGMRQKQAEYESQLAKLRATL